MIALLIVSVCICLFLVVLFWVRWVKYLVAINGCVDDLRERDEKLVKRIQRAESDILLKINKLDIKMTNKINKLNEEKE